MLFINAARKRLAREKSRVKYVCACLTVTTIFGRWGREKKEKTKGWASFRSEKAQTFEHISTDISINWRKCFSFKVHAALCECPKIKCNSIEIKAKSTVWNTFTTFHLIFGVFCIRVHLHCCPPPLPLICCSLLLWFFVWYFCSSGSVMGAGIRFALRTDCTKEVQSTKKKRTALRQQIITKKKNTNNSERESDGETKRRTVAPHNNSMQY